MAFVGTTRRRMNIGDCAPPAPMFRARQRHSAAMGSNSQQLQRRRPSLQEDGTAAREVFGQTLPWNFNLCCALAGKCGGCRHAVTSGGNKTPSCNSDRIIVSCAILDCVFIWFIVELERVAHGRHWRKQGGQPKDLATFQLSALVSSWRLS